MRTIALLFTLMPFICFAQKMQDAQLKFKSESFLIVYLDKYGNFEMESGWQDVTHTILFDAPHNKISLIGTNNKSYNLLSKSEEYIEGKTTIIKWNNCISNEGSKCSVRIMYPTKGSLKDQNSYLYIDNKYQTITFKMTME